MYCAFQIDFESLNNKQDATDGVCIVFTFPTFHSSGKVGWPAEIAFLTLPLNPERWSGDCYEMSIGKRLSILINSRHKAEPSLKGISFADVDTGSSRAWSRH